MTAMRWALGSIGGGGAAEFARADTCAHGDDSGDSTDELISRGRQHAAALAAAAAEP